MRGYKLRCAERLVALGWMSHVFDVGCLPFCLLGVQLRKLQRPLQGWLSLGSLGLPCGRSCIGLLRLPFLRPNNSRPGMP